MSSEKARIDWVDTAKAVGIMLMFYGHFLQRGVDPHNASAQDQLRFIYSFHMPLFFVLSGMFFHAPAARGLQLSRLVTRRLLPVAFFGLLLLPLWFRDELSHHVHLWHDSVDMGMEYLRGRPDLNWVTWFLVCLFVCESMALFTVAYIRNSYRRILFALACILGGIYFCDHSHSQVDGAAYSIGRFWFLSEAIVGLGFYAFGSAIKDSLVALGDRRLMAGIVCVVALVGVLATYRLNAPPGGVVMMAARVHGNAFEFAATALFGSVAAIAFSIVLPPYRWLRWIGRHTLPLLGLNGLFFHYVDPKLGSLWPIPDAQLAVFLDSLTITIVSLCLCVPFTYLLDRFVPQLIGKSNVPGPWLPALERQPIAHSS